MTDVLGPGDARWGLPVLWTSLPAGVRRLAAAAALVLAAGVLTVVHGLPDRPVLLVAADGVVALRPDGGSVRVALPHGLAPVRLLRLGSATVVLARPPLQRTGGRALLLRDPSGGLRDLGPADALVPDSRGDRVWLVRDGAPQRLAAFDARGRARGTRQVADPHDLLLVTPDAVLDDEVVVPGGSTPTLRSDRGQVLRRLPGPVQVLDVAGPRLLVTDGTCQDGCTARVWDVRTGRTADAPLDAGLVVLDGALSTDGRSVALAGRETAAGAALDGDLGQAVLLRGPLDGNEPHAAVVRGGCSLRSCQVTWRGTDVYASVDLVPGTLVRWGAVGAPERVPLTVPSVVDLAGLP